MNRIRDNFEEAVDVLPLERKIILRETLLKTIQERVSPETFSLIDGLSYLSESIGEGE